MDSQPQLPSDGQLVAATRGQMSGAWDELRRRHHASVSGVAKARQRRGHKRAVSSAFDSLHDEILETEPDQEAAIRAVRPRLLSKLTGGTYGPGDAFDNSDLVGAVATRTMDEDAELASLARAFASLPEPWQTALWHRMVELQPAAEFAPMLGRTANESAAVVQRAEAGLFEGFLIDQRAHGSTDDECRPIIPLLGGSLRSTISAHEQRLVDDHLADDSTSATRSCRACSRRLQVSKELSSLLPTAIVPELAGMSVDRYRAASGVRIPAAVVAETADRRRNLVFGGSFVLLLLAAVVSAIVFRGSLEDLDATPIPPDATVAPDSTVPTTPRTDPSTPTTTELELRPTPTGPVNLVEVVFEEQDLVGFASSPADTEVVLASPGPVFAGGTGTIDIIVTNTGDEPSAAQATLKVPSGIVFDALVDGPAECVDPVDDSASCTVTVDAGATEVVTVRFRLGSVVVGRLVVESNLAAENVDVPISAIHRLVHSSIDRGRMVTIGNGLMTCDDTAPSCLDARDGVGDVLNRWDLPARHINVDPALGWINSSRATLDVGEDSIEAAYLFWSGDLNERGVQIPDDGSSAQVRMLPPGADEAVELEAERIRLGDVDATQYFGHVDVTDLVKFFGSGDYLVGEVQSVEVQGSYAGWSMVVVTRHDDLPRRSLTMVSPFAWFSPEHDYGLDLPTPLGSEQTATLDVVAFEGERGFEPGFLTVGGTQLGDAAFDSTIIGPRDPRFDNNFGTDIDAYDLVIDTPEGFLPITATSDKDGIRLAVLALTVDVE